MSSHPYEFETLKIQDNLVLAVNGVEGDNQPLHTYLAARSRAGWKVEGMAGSSAPLTYFILLKKKLHHKDHHGRKNAVKPGVIQKGEDSQE